MDQRAMETQLLRATNTSFGHAWNLYTRGAFSKSYAELTLVQPLAVDVPKGTQVVGLAVNEGEALGWTMKDAMAGESVVVVQYYVSPLQESMNECHVGGNPDPVVDGCKYKHME